MTPTRPARHARRILCLGIVWVLGGLVPAAASGQALVPLEHTKEVAKDVLGPTQCGESCHTDAYTVWLTTRHAKGYDGDGALHKRQRAKDIAKKLGLLSVKRKSPCLTCHFTPRLSKTGNLSALSGTSCESCHGAAADWLSIHNDYGGPEDENATRETETPAQKAERARRASAAGMKRPSDLYPVIANCYQCHLIPNQEIIEVGGHRTASTSFEFVKFSQDKGIRHNFLGSEGAGGQGTVNARRSEARRRLMYVVGQAVGLEYSLRGAAAATSDGKYLRALGKRVEAHRGSIEDINGAVSLPELSAILSATSGVSISAGADAALLKAADEVGRQARAIVANHATTDLSKIDEVASTETAEVTADPTFVAKRTPPPPPPPAPSAAFKAAGGVPAQGELRSDVRNPRPPKGATIDPDECSGCHDSQQEWLDQHPHGASHLPFLGKARKNSQIAMLYYGEKQGLDWIDKGQAVCSDCHATIEGSNFKRKVGYGVTCQQCHGAAGPWIEAHKDAPDSAKKVAGMKDLSNPATLAENCTSCHYITDERLLSSGHPSGQDFQYDLESIKHWRKAKPSTSGIQAQIGKRGPVPSVRLGKLPDGAAAKSKAAEQAAVAADPTLKVAVEQGAAAVAAKVASGEAPPPSAGTGTVAAPGKPAGPATPEEKLRAVHQRILEIHNAD
ncbi:MAG: multiheme c-type cytochrome [Myxococcota bacterium]|nr:multiheme c-type cytochrome [Myxococcota bacterium]